MFKSLLNDREIQKQEKETVVAVLYEAKVEEEEILRLLKKYCKVGGVEALNILQNEKFINSPCRKLENYLLLEKGYNYEEADFLNNRYAIHVLATNPELSKVTPNKLYSFVKEYQKKFSE